MKLEELVNKFDIKGQIISIEENNVGNINKTYIVNVMNDGKKEKYLLQKINTTVFNEPYLLMQNIELVTDYIKKYYKDGNKTDFINVIRTKNGNNLVKTDNDEFYRMYNFIDNTITYDSVENSEMFKNVGQAFGSFAKVLNDFPMDKLNETIKNFHNSKER